MHENIDTINITEADLHKELEKQSHDLNMTFHEWLLYKRHYYQKTNFTLEQKDVNQVDEMYTKPSSLVQAELPAMLNRTNQD